MTQERLFFLTGAPRTGTTFLSDWVMEARGSYCVHEVLSTLSETTTPAMLLAHLRTLARTGADRLEKVAQRAFLDWDDVKVEAYPRVIGWKEPIQPRVLDSTARFGLARPISPFVEAFRVPIVIARRHPLDILASARRRAETTANWPDYTIQDLARFWLSAEALVANLKDQSWPHLVLHWEELVADFTAVRTRYGNFLGLPLPISTGRERTKSYLLRARASVCPRRGWVGNPARAAIAKGEADALRAALGAGLESAGYVFERGAGS